MYFLVKCVIHTQHYRGDDAIFIFLENTKEKKNRVNNAKLVVYNLK